MTDPVVPESQPRSNSSVNPEGDLLTVRGLIPPVQDVCAERVSARVSPHLQWLQQTGALVVGSGVLLSEQYSVALHSDFGPLNQDKTTNQDYALAWRANPTLAKPESNLIVAVADGVTSSFRAEWAAALACSVAAHALAQSVEVNSEPRQKLEAAVAAAANALKELADDFARNPQESCPFGMYLATWKYMLRRGRLLQTTLMLLWLDGHRLRAAVVGDGGLLWRVGQPPQTGVGAQCDLATQEVHAIGPGSEQPIVLDDYVELELPSPFLCALFTDGVGRGLGTNPATLLDELANQETMVKENPAADFLARAIVERGKDFADNLTLAVLRGG